MKNENKISWLQLSDLHMFASTNVERQKKALYKQFKETTDFIAITGDLHQFGKNYTMSNKFLNELVNEFNIKKSDIVIVPGNHDISSSDERNKAVKNIDENIENNPDIYRNDLNKLYSAFTKYKAFLKKFYGNERSGQNLLENHIYVWNDKLALLCLNTALVSDENHHKPQIVDIYGLEKLENSGLPCIAVMHHDYYAISDIHKPYIKNRFKELGVSATLSGHKHRSSKNVIELGKNETIPNFCCAKSVSQPGDLWSDVGIIEYRWDLKENTVLVIPYEWDSHNLNFAPITRFENSEKNIVDANGCIVLDQHFKFRHIPAIKTSMALKKTPSTKKKTKKTDYFETFYEDVQKIYLDGILKHIGNNDKYKQSVDIMERIITYNDENLNFNQMIDLIISCKEKMVLSINGLQGTGKSTFLSLVYYELKKRYSKTNIFPILIDLHALDNYSKMNAKSTLQEHLKIIDDLITEHQEIKFILMFDGADDYVRKTSDLENTIFTYVINSNLSNFAFCIGSADNLPNAMVKTSKLQSFSHEATYKLETHRVKKDDDENITVIIKNLLSIYSFKINQNDISAIKKAINIYTISEVDYRTLLIVLRVFEANLNNKYNDHLGSYFYEYYLMEMHNDEAELCKHAKAAYQYVILKKANALRSLKHAKIIYNNGITIDFLLAYYFVYIVKNASNDLADVLKSDFVFTASVNKFIKDLILKKYGCEQTDMVNKLISAYDDSDMSMQSQICYILGRFEENNAKTKAKNFLISKWSSLYENLFYKDKLKSQNPDIKSELVLFRTISVSLIWLGYDKNQETFLRCLLFNEKLNQINRGFHLEYYEDKAYINGVSPSYVDDENISVDKTMNYLIDNIEKSYSKNEKFKKSIYLDIVTLFSIYQYRMEDERIRKDYGDTLFNIAKKILKSPEIQSRTIINYITTVKDSLTGNPYKKTISEFSVSKNLPREGWVRRKVKNPESIAAHMYMCTILAKFFLPENVAQCIDYHIPDIDNYLDYSKSSIIEMLLLHDLAEVRTGDIVTQEKVKSDVVAENRFFDYCEFLCSFPYIYGLGNQKSVWDEFAGNTTINAKIANDIDKIEPLIQADLYEKDGNEIDLNEWIEYARKNVVTSLGKQFLQLVITKIIK